MSETRDRRNAARPPIGETATVHEVVERNIRALLIRRRAEEANKSAHERIADAVTRFTGSMRFVYIHLVLSAHGSRSTSDGFRSSSRSIRRS